MGEESSLLGTREAAKIAKCSAMLLETLNSNQELLEHSPGKRKRFLEVF